LFLGAEEKIRIWNLELFGIWNLEFGIWELGFGIWESICCQLLVAVTQDFRLGRVVHPRRRAYLKLRDLNLLNNQSNTLIETAGVNHPSQPEIFARE
jgi:hypothetical protein